MSLCKCTSWVSRDPPEKGGLTLVNGNDLPPQLRVGSGRHLVRTRKIVDAFETLCSPQNGEARPFILTAVCA